MFVKEHDQLLFRTTEEEEPTTTMMMRMLQYNITSNVTTSNVTTIAPEEEDDNDESSNLIFVVGSNILLFLLIYGLSATVQVKNLRKQLSNTFALLTGVGMQFVIMPLLGFLAVMALKHQDEFTKAMGLTLLVVTASPGGSYSNWWCSLFNADLALSVAMTSVSTILSIGLLPANLLLYSHLAYGKGDKEADNLVGAIDFGALFISLGVVMGAIIGGLATSYYVGNPTFARWANRGASISGFGLILLSFFLSTGTGTKDDEEDDASPVWEQHWTFFVGVAMPCLLGIFLANFFARFFRLKRPECVAIAIECCYQNTGIATSVAVTMFDDPKERAQAVAIPLLYGVVEAVVIGIYCVMAWKIGWTKAPPNENCCTVIANSYEIEEEEEFHDGTANGISGTGGGRRRRGSTSELDLSKDHHKKQRALQDLEAGGGGGSEARLRKVTSNLSSSSSADGFEALSSLEQPSRTMSSSTSSRIRFVSEDVTVMTESSSPSVTPVKLVYGDEGVCATPSQHAPSYENPPSYPPITSVPSNQSDDSNRTDSSYHHHQHPPITSVPSNQSDYSNRTDSSYHQHPPITSVPSNQSDYSS